MTAMTALTLNYHLSRGYIPKLMAYMAESFKIADTAKIRATLGFTPSASFREGMHELIRWSEKAVAIDLVDTATAELKARGIVEA